MLDHGVPTEDYAVAAMREMAKDRRTKQIAYLRMLGVESDDDMTKTEASELIEQVVARKVAK